MKDVERVASYAESIGKQNTPKEDRVREAIHTRGECLGRLNSLKDEYRDTLSFQILKIQEKLGKQPSKNKMMENCFETKIKPHSFHLHSQGVASKWFSKINYVGVNADSDPYIKTFVVGHRKYQSVLVKNIKYIDDIAKISDYLKITYNI